jgi:hypothetical protein
MYDLCLLIGGCRCIHLISAPFPGIGSREAQGSSGHRTSEDAAKAAPGYEVSFQTFQLRQTDEIF